MVKIKKMLPTRWLRFWRMRWHNKLLLGILLFGLLSGGSIVVTSQPGFCNSCHIMNSYYASWQTSKHSEVNCLDCHLQPGFNGYIRGKINGLAQAVDCAVGRYGTKPNATVFDMSCLRSECHSTKELVETTVDFQGIKFKHDKHMDKIVDGITITCGTCHSHFEGEEHFNVNTDVCFTCHFLKSTQKKERLVQATCQSCHEIPNKTIKRGLIEINHAEFVSYQASCEESCHKKLIEQPSEVSESVCLNCHNYTKQYLADSVDLHEKHSLNEKVECFACHGKVIHKKSLGTSVATMINCTSCHSDTHNIQANIYSAKDHTQQEEDARILSPMFLTHVECTGCHIKPSRVTSAAIGSIGMVAKAVPQACDSCHEPGTGQKYVPFWQEQIKKLHTQVSENLNRLQDSLRTNSNPDAMPPLDDRMKQAQSLLQSVESDGSWGVHNLKYTEAMLLKANDIINQTRKDYNDPQYKN